MSPTGEFKVTLTIVAIIALLVSLLVFFYASKRKSAAPKEGFHTTQQGFSDTQWREQPVIPITYHDSGPGGPVKNFPSFLHENTCTKLCSQQQAAIAAAGDRDPDYVMKAYELCTEACRMNWKWLKRT